jgi:hypothetical protein
MRLKFKDFLLDQEDTIEKLPQAAFHGIIILIP